MYVSSRNFPAASCEFPPKCIYVCIYGQCMYVRTYPHTHVRVCVYMYVCVCMYVCMYVCTYVCNTYVAFLCVGIPEGGLCMYPQGLWLCCPEIYVCTYVCTKGVYVHMCVCIYVSKSNEGSQLIYIQPWAQGCREGGWPLRGVRGCRHKALLDALCTYICMYIWMCRS